MNICAIIQARMGSSRLPGKALLPLAGVPVIQLVVERARLIEGVDQVLVATTTSPTDDGLAAFCTAQGIPVHRGSESDVLDRYCAAARQLGADVVVRITGDCPFIDPVESAKVVRAFLAHPGCDYASNTNPPFLPDGMDTEVVRFAALERAWRVATDLPSREHVTWYIRTHQQDFVVKAVGGEPDRSAYRLTLDEPADYEVLSALADEVVARKLFGHVDELIGILRGSPAIARANAHIGRDEGLRKSLEQQKALENNA